MRRPTADQGDLFIAPDGDDDNPGTAGPCFVDPANADFRLQPGSPAITLGFKPIDSSKIGLRDDFLARCR